MQIHYQSWLDLHEQRWRWIYYIPILLLLLLIVRLLVLFRFSESIWLFSSRACRNNVELTNCQFISLSLLLHGNGMDNMSSMVYLCKNDSWFQQTNQITMLMFLQNKESLPLIKICNYLKLIRRHFVLMIEGKQRRRRRENELLCLAKVTMLSEKKWIFFFPQAVTFSSKNTMHLILNELYLLTLNFEV